MPRLFVVPTRIGNLEDITVRALRVLREVDLVLAEDTRHTRKLFARYGIETALQSYHQHNKLERLDGILALLAEHDVALVSDAGTPSIADPGYELVRAAIEHGVEVDVLPGASAVLTAVVAAALPAPGWIFLGFAPRTSGDRRRWLAPVGNLPYSLVLFEAPHRLVATLDDLALILGDRSAMVARELTKMHQELARDRLSALAIRFRAVPPRGECTVVVQGAEPAAPDQAAAARALRSLREAGRDRRSAVAEVSADTGLGRNAFYRLWLTESNGSDDV